MGGVKGKSGGRFYSEKDGQGGQQPSSCSQPLPSLRASKQMTPLRHFSSHRSPDGWPWIVSPARRNLITPAERSEQDGGDYNHIFEVVVVALTHILARLRGATLLRHSVNFVRTATYGRPSINIHTGSRGPQSVYPVNPNPLFILFKDETFGKCFTQYFVMLDAAVFPWTIVLCSCGAVHSV